MPRRDQPSAVASSRGGFTLVELLAVIMIIALLAALLTPAVMNARRSARAAAVKAEIDLLHMALMNYKNEYGSFPPSDMRGLWNGVSNQVNTAHPVYRHLQRIFPRMNEQTSGVGSPFFWMAQMSPAQAMVFWLDGYFDNPQYPLTSQQVLTAAMPRAGTANFKRKKLFEFDQTRLYAATEYWQPTSPVPFVVPAINVVAQSAQRFAERNQAPSAFARDYPVYFPSQGNTGLPYVYFASSSYSTTPLASVTSAIGPGLSTDLYYNAVSLTNGDNSAAAPYFNSVNCSSLAVPPQPPQYSWAEIHMNSDTFQLISAGGDGNYGSEAASFPANAITNPATGLAAPFLYGALNHGPFLSVKSSPKHDDNITNFASGSLKEAAEKLLAQ